MDVDSRLKAKQFLCSMNFKSGDDHADDHKRLEPVPETFKSCVKINFYYFFIFHLILLAVSCKEPSNTMEKYTSQGTKDREPSDSINQV